MMRKVNKLSGAVLAIAALALSGGLGAAESLQEALVAAYASNPTLLAERARLRGTDESVAQARAGWRPSISLSADYSHRERRSASTRSFTGIDLPIVVTSKTFVENYSIGSVVNQPLFRGFQTINSSKEAKARVRAGRADLWVVEQQILLDAVAAYRDVIRDAATVALNENSVRVLQRQLEASEHRFRVGEITRTDVAQSSARVSLARSNLSEARAFLAESRARYEVVVGQAPGTLDSNTALPDLPDSLDSAVAGALDSNPSLISARENEEAAKYTVSVQKGGLLPSVDLRVQYSHNEDTNRKGAQSTSYVVAAQGTFPLYQGGAQYSRIRQAKEGYSQARIQVAERRRAVIGATTTAWEIFIAAGAVIESSREQVRANEIAFDGVQQEAQVGSRTTLDVLDAEQELLDSQVALVRAQREQFVAAYSLLAAVGKLTAEDQGLQVDLYDPEVNYEAIDHKWFGHDTISD